MKNVSQAPRESISLQAQPAHLIRHVDERLMSYNIERDEQNSWKEQPTNKANGNRKSLGHLKGAKTIAR